MIKRFFRRLNTERPCRSPLRRLTLLAKHGGKGAQRLIYRHTVRKYIQYIWIDDDNIGPLSVSRRGHTSNGRREVILAPHCVHIVLPATIFSVLLHSVCAHLALPASLRSDGREAIFRQW